ncbi:MAG: efflux RND transporter periplasmic adaptor subunit [Paraclostridium sp.]
MGMKEKLKNIKFTNKQMIIGGIVIVALAVGGFVIVKKRNAGMGAGEEVAAGPELYNVPGKEKIFVNGKIVPVQSKDLFVNGEAGEIDQIKVEDGKKVDKGAPLFTCKNESIISDISDKKEELSKKEKDKKNTTDEEMKKSLDSEIADIKKEISKLEGKAYTTVYAPFTGKVYINDKTENGEQQSPAIMTIETEEFYIKGQASEQDLSKISLNQEVEILVYSTKGKFSGKIASIGERPSTEQSGDMMGNQNMSYYDIKMSFNDGQDLSKVKNGFHVQTTIEAGNQAIKLPKTAVKQEDGKSYVFKVIDGIIYKQEVQLGETTEEYAIIIEGVLEEDDVIRYADDETIKDGASIYPGEAGATDEMLPMEDDAKDENAAEGEAEVVE